MRANMTTQINDGGPAFPCECGGDPDTNEHQTGNHLWQQYGMTLRDYFAGEELSKTIGCAVCDRDESYDRLAKHCYRMADAMLKARAQ